jgi:hypothetical protein
MVLLSSIARNHPDNDPAALGERGIPVGKVVIRLDECMGNDVRCVAAQPKAEETLSRTVEVAGVKPSIVEIGIRRPK